VNDGCNRSPGSLLPLRYQFYRVEPRASARARLRRSFAAKVSHPVKFPACLTDDVGTRLYIGSVVHGGLDVTSASQQVANAGLTARQVEERHVQYGPNAVPEEHPHRLLLFLRKFWSPVPWMLEVTLALELILGKYTQTIIISALLVLNAVLSFLQENRASNALGLLRQRLTIQVRVLRDDLWQLITAQDLVPGDVIHVRVGDFIPADLRLHEGRILVDQSALTGESTAREMEPGQTAYAGSVVRRGEATGEVTATGQRTYYGKTAELVHAAKSPSHLENVIFTIVKYLVVMDLFLVGAILVYAIMAPVDLTEIIPFALILLVASVPVALPATYTLAGALGSLELSRQGILVTRLSAIEDAAAMDILCSDKTGTITKNQLAVAGLRVFSPHSEADLLRLAALACDESTQDPIDLAILDAAKSQGVLNGRPQRLRFLPFDPATKRSEALVSDEEGVLQVVKGAPSVVASLSNKVPIPDSDVESLAAEGCRVLAVAAGPEGKLQFVGLIALQDPPREDSRAVIQDLQNLGVRIVMVTGDGKATAHAIAAKVGIEGRTCLADRLREDGRPAPDCAVFAGVFPEDKFRLVRAFQHEGHVVGMTGDGVNDAPALKQAEVGIAVANATDVAKAAASIVLTGAGLTGVLAAVETGRRIYQRMLTYTLNKIVKTFQIALLLSFGLLLTGDFVTTPRLILLLLFANDFVTMSLAADRVTFSRKPDRWQIRRLVVVGLALASAWLAFSFAVFLLGRHWLALDLPRVQTLVFVVLVFTGQATVYLVRERRHVWASLPGPWLISSSVADVVVVSVMAIQGILMPAISPILVFGILVSVVFSVILLDLVKVRLLRQSDLD
jgi:H+-transporting ATPase